MGELNFGQNFVDQGLLVMIWHQVKTAQVAADEVLFTLRFEALEDAARLSDLLSIDENHLAAEAYKDGAAPKQIRLEFESRQAQEFTLLQNQPNPFKDQTIIGFYLPEATSATLQILDVSGRMIREIPGDYSAGYQEISLSRSDLPATGVLYYRLETATNVATKKMILAE